MGTKYLSAPSSCRYPNSWLFVATLVLMTFLSACVLFTGQKNCLTSEGLVREVRITGAADTLYVGDTVHYEATMPWEGAPNNTTGEPVSLDLRRIPTLTWPVYLYAQYAPLGNIPDSLLPANGPARPRFGFTPGTVEADAERVISMDGGRSFTLFADTLAPEWRVTASVTFDQPGRYLISWQETIDDSPLVDVTRSGIAYYDNPDDPGCRQQVIISDHLVGYVNNRESVARAEAASNVFMRTNVPETSNALYYVIVLDEP